MKVSEYVCIGKLGIVPLFLVLVVAVVTNNPLVWVLLLSMSTTVDAVDRYLHYIRLYSELDQLR